jgi:hypothetical protein
VLGRQKNLDASWYAGLAADEAVAFESYDHLMNGWRTDAKMSLDIGLGGRLSEHMRLGMDESEIVTLLLGRSHA